MSRYIDADALIEELNRCSYETWCKGVNSTWWAHSVRVKDNIVKCIERQPTADVVEVVRCKDCKEKLIQPDGTMRCRLSGRTKSAGDYCSSADKIVYCKDCKHLMFSDCYGECAEAHKGIVQPDDYCSYGERREG